MKKNRKDNESWLSIKVLDKVNFETTFASIQFVIVNYDSNAVLLSSSTMLLDLEDSYQSLIKDSNLCYSKEDIEMYFHLAKATLENLVDGKFSFDREHDYYDNLDSWVDYFLRFNAESINKREWFINIGCHLSVGFLESIEKRIGNLNNQLLGDDVVQISKGGYISEYYISSSEITKKINNLDTYNRFDMKVKSICEKKEVYLFFDD